MGHWGFGCFAAVNQEFDEQAHSQCPAVTVWSPLPLQACNPGSRWLLHALQVRCGLCRVPYHVPYVCRTVASTVSPLPYLLSMLPYRAARHLSPGRSPLLITSAQHNQLLGDCDPHYTLVRNIPL